MNGLIRASLRNPYAVTVMRLARLPPSPAACVHRQLTYTLAVRKPWGSGVLNPLIVGAGRVGAEPLYRLTVPDTPGGTFSRGYAVTASGQVAGEENCP
jgi:hypothetical protein